MPGKNIQIAYRAMRKNEHGIVMWVLALAALSIFTPCSLAAETSHPCTEKKIIGQVCRVYVEELGLDFLARIDTGAAATSIHAYDLTIEDGTNYPWENVGKTISFLTQTDDGQVARMSAEIVRIQNVVNAQGREKRYMVNLTLNANGTRKKVLANLRDRSRMKYKLLMGRDWLASDFLVDVDKAEELTVEEGEEE